MPTSGYITARQHVERRREAMELERRTWDDHYKDLNRNFSPRRGKFYTSDRNKGTRRNMLVNNTPLFASRVLTSGLMTGVTSPARPWFRLAPPDPGMSEFSPVRNWLDEVETLMYRVFSSSNLYKVLPTVYQELAVFGTAACIQEEDFDEIMRFTPFTVGEYYLDMNGDLKVDTFFREYQMTVYQMVHRFGLENVTPQVKEKWDTSNYNSWFDVHHLIEPVSMTDHQEFKLPDRFKWRSIYWQPGNEAYDGKFLQIKGFKHFPILAPRWDTRAGDTYGYSPGMEALGDSKALQVQEREKGKAIAKMVSPPTVAPSSLKNSQVSLLPGSANFTDDPNQVFRAVYQVTPQVRDLAEDILKTEDRISRAFFVDLFMLISSQEDVRTATEIAARQEEKLLQLGPVLEGLHDELLDPLIDRTFDMLVELSRPGWAGVGPKLLSPPPEELQDSQLRVEFISVLAQAQKLVGTSAMERWVAFTGQLGGFKPEAIDKINADGIVEQMAEDLGVPADAVMSDEAVKVIREQRQREKEQMQQQQNLGSAVEAAKSLGGMKTTSDTVAGQLLGQEGAA